MAAQRGMGVSVGIFKKKLSATDDLRKGTDRRTQEQKRSYDRRVRPDRRLSNILVEWISFSEITSHPTIREALSSRRNKKKAPETRRKEQPVVGAFKPFKNKLSATVDLRKVTDRRIQEQQRPYDRRVRPDRRLSKISVEWIPY
jgi:hypothetical protein